MQLAIIAKRRAESPLLNGVVSALTQCSADQNRNPLGRRDSKPYYHRHDQDHPESTDNP